MASGTQNMTTDKARILSTSSGTTKFWRSDNSWSNTLTGTLNLTAGSGTPLSITGAGGKIFAFKLSNGAQNMDIGWEYSPLTGSGAAFRSKDDTAGPGEFLIYARSDSGTVQLWGKPNGVLTWGGNRIPVANSSGNAGSQYAPVYSNAGILTEITGGTSAQFYRGDKTWSNTIVGSFEVSGGNLVIRQPDDHRDYGVYGTYNYTKAATIWSMGTAYKIAADGSGLGNLYGAAYGYGGQAHLDSKAFGGGHQFLWCQNGSVYVALGSHVWSYTAGCSWIDGQRYNNAAYNVSDMTNTGSYWPWMRGTNTSSEKWFSLGVLNNSFYIIGSTTSRTENSYDYCWRFDVSDGYLYGNFSGPLSGNAATATKIAAKLATTTKTFLLGTSTTITSTAANVDLIGDTGVYLTTTAGQLSAKSYSINDGTNEKVRMEWNATDQSLDFIFI